LAKTLDASIFDIVNLAKDAQARGLCIAQARKEHR